MSDRHPVNGAGAAQRSDADGDAIYRALETALRLILKLSPGSDLAARSPIELGLSSIGAITLQHRVQAATGIELSIREILGDRSVAALGELVRERQCAASEAAARAAAVRQGGVLI